jgi:hypothetical protein
MVIQSFSLFSCFLVCLFYNNFKPSAKAKPEQTPFPLKKLNKDKHYDYRIELACSSHCLPSELKHPDKHLSSCSARHIFPITCITSLTHRDEWNQPTRIKTTE